MRFSLELFFCLFSLWCPAHSWRFKRWPFFDYLLFFSQPFPKISTTDTHKRTLGQAGDTAQKSQCLGCHGACSNSLVKEPCRVTFSSQAVVRSSESVTRCISPRLRQCANNYREPEACVCIWRRNCAVGGMCSAAALCSSHDLDSLM